MDSGTGQDGALLGRTLGSYRIERLLGRGGMGAVFLAYDTSLHRQVALKVVAGAAGDASSQTQLVREARSAAALNHPAICTIHEVGNADGTPFIAMEYVNGRSLSDRLREGALPVDLAMRYGLQAADALAYAHEHGVIHRDFKAANATVTPEGQLKIIDFGLARRRDALAGSATTVVSVVPAGTVRRHAVRNGARTGARRGCRRTHGHLGARGCAVRNAGGVEAVWRRDDPGAVLSDLEGRAGAPPGSVRGGTGGVGGARGR